MSHISCVMTEEMSGALMRTNGFSDTIGRMISSRVLSSEMSIRILLKTRHSAFVLIFREIYGLEAGETVYSGTI